MTQVKKHPSSSTLSKTSNLQFFTMFSNYTWNFVHVVKEDHTWRSDCFIQLVNLKNVVASDQSQLQITQSQKSQNIVVDAYGLGYKMKLVAQRPKAQTLKVAIWTLAWLFYGGRHGLRDRQEEDLSSSLATLINNSTTSTIFIVLYFSKLFKI